MTLGFRKSRELVLSRSRLDWLFDVSGLIAQGVIIPALQILVGLYLYKQFLPELQGQLRLNGILSFLLSFVFVDYLYYWNHRLLHVKKLWPTHALHHTAKSYDFLITSRNTLWTPVLLVYLWVNSFFIFILSDAKWFIVGVSLTAALDLWRHSTFMPKYFPSFFVTSKDHAWHHSTEISNVNFGANFSLWDKLHGTFHSTSSYPRELGIDFQGSPLQKLIFPFGAGQ
jgi:sterol desaturase/sphingolipid hydroxylase (fatty acid hydroxylase superfamily)